MLGYLFEEEVDTFTITVSELVLIDDISWSDVRLLVSSVVNTGFEILRCDSDNTWVIGSEYFMYIDPDPFELFIQKLTVAEGIEKVSKYDVLDHFDSCVNNF